MVYVISFHSSSFHSFLTRAFWGPFFSLFDAKGRSRRKRKLLSQTLQAAGSLILGGRRLGVRRGRMQVRHGRGRRGCRHVGRTAVAGLALLAVAGHLEHGLMFGLPLVNAWLGAEAARFVVIRVLVAGIRGWASGSVLGSKSWLRHWISHPGLIDLQCGGGCKERREQN